MTTTTQTPTYTDRPLTIEQALQQLIRAGSAAQEKPKLSAAGEIVRGLRPAEQG